MAHPTLIAGVAVAVLIPIAVVAPLLTAEAAANAAVQCLSGDVAADAVLHADDGPSIVPVPSAAAPTSGNDVVWPVGKGQMGGLHPTGARDMGRGLGHPVVAAHGGTVSASADIPPQAGRRNGGGYGSYGRYVVISWKNNNGQWLNNLYAHMRTRKVQQGDTVTAGQLIGYVGSTGNSSGPHLHFELFSSSGANGISGSRSGHDPAPWLSQGKEPDIDALPVDDSGDVTAQECEQSGGITAELPVFGSGSGPYTDNPAPMRTKGVTRTPQQAAQRLVAWANEPRYGYAHLCLKLADQAYSITGSGMPRAIDQWYRAKAAGYAHPNDRHVPVGAQMFWWSSNDARHIATYIGGGKVVTNMTSEGGIVKIVPAQSLDSWGPYLGWAEPYYVP